jgi:hypothetical protein
LRYSPAKCNPTTVPVATSISADPEFPPSVELSWVIALTSFP